MSATGYENNTATAARDRAVASGEYTPRASADEVRSPRREVYPWCALAGLSILEDVPMAAPAEPIMRMSLARRDDAAAIAEMSRRLIEHGLPWTWDERRVAHCIANRECVVLTAREQRRMAGFAIMHFYDDHAHLGLLAVHAGFRRRGVGRALVEWLEASARVAGTFLVNLELRDGNHSAYEFYRRLGYREMGRRKGYYSGREDAICMRHDLAVVPAGRT